MGLRSVNTVGTVTTWVGGSAGCRLIRSNSIQLETPLRSAGMTDAELDTLRHTMLDSDTAVWSYQMFTTTGQRMA